MGRPRYSCRVNAHSKHDTCTMFCSLHWFAYEPIHLERHIDVPGVMLLLAKSHYQATLGWIMGPLLRLWRWFIALFSKSQDILTKNQPNPMAENTSPSNETTSSMEVESNLEIPEDVQQPAMYIYNLSRSQWANRLNLDWIYLDVMERGENRFILFVNTVPEEPTRGYSEEMDGAFEALSHWMTYRNEHPLHSIESMSTTKGELVLGQHQFFERDYHFTQRSKRLLFAGGNKIFYRQLARGRCLCTFKCVKKKASD